MYMFKYILTIAGQTAGPNWLTFFRLEKFKYFFTIQIFVIFFYSTGNAETLADNKYI